MEQTATVKVMMDIAAPNRSGGKMYRSKAELTLINPAAPTAWATRNTIKTGREVASPQHNEAAVNSAMPHKYTTRYPCMSPSEAKGSRLTVTAS